MKSWIAAFFITTIAWGQISVSASRTVVVPTLETRFVITARTGNGVPFADVLAAIRSTGATANEIYSVQTTAGIQLPPGVTLPPGTPNISGGTTWSFLLNTRTSELAANLAKFAAAVNEARTVSGGRVTVTYVVQSQVPTRTDLESARRSVLPELWSDLKSQAELLSSSTGAPLEGLASLTEASAIYGDIFDYSSLLSSVYAGIAGITGTTLPVTAPVQYKQTFSLAAAFTNNPAPGTDGVFVANYKPDTSMVQVPMSVTVAGPVQSTVEQIVASISTLGVTAADLQSLAIVTTAGSGTPNAGAFTFTRPVPTGQLGAVLTAADAVRARLGQAVTISFSGLASTPSEREAAKPGAWSELAAMTKTQAQELARAAGYDAGDLLGVSEYGGLNSYLTAYTNLGFGFRAPHALSARYELKK